MRLPDRWIFITVAVTVGISAVSALLIPSLRTSFTSGWEVRELLRFRERFRPERVGRTCPAFALHRLGACAHAMIIEENRLQYASMTGRIYYLATIAEVVRAADEFARTRAEKVETRADFLEYLNEEMKSLLVQTGGSVDLAALDRRDEEDASEEGLTRRYHANLVDLWVKNWRTEEKFFSTYSALGANAPLQTRLTVLRADRDELFSRIAIDFSRWNEQRMPAALPAPEPAREVVNAPEPDRKPDALSVSTTFVEEPALEEPLMDQVPNREGSVQ